MQYLRGWSARVSPRSFRKKTLHGDIMCLARIVERAAERAGTDPGFGNATGGGVKFIEQILISAAVIPDSNDDKYRGSISREIRRYHGKVKELKNSQSH